MDTGISAILLAYQEEENLKVLIPRIKEQLIKIGEPFEIIVIDSEKPLDNTEAVCLKEGCRYVNQEEPHFGGAFRTGIKYASMDKFLILDSDGSHDPIYIPQIYEMFKKGEKDIVIGSRYVEGGHTDDAKSSIIMSHILNFVFRTFLGIKAKDISTDYRMYWTSDLKGVTLENQNYDVLQEVLLKIGMNKPGGRLNIGEVPISFHKRMFGALKRRLIPFILDYLKSLIKLISIRFPTLYHLVLYGLFGAIAACLEYGTFTVLLYFRIFQLPEIANICGAVLGFLFTFVTNTFLNFKKNDKLIRRFSTYLLICVGGMVTSTLCISLLKDVMNIYVLKLLLLIVISIAQFMLNKVITYKM